MELLISCFLILTIASSALTLPFAGINYRYTLKESIDHPRGWQQVSAAPAEHIIRLRIGLHQPNFDELERHLDEVSNPLHPRYGQHLSKAEVEELITPHKNSIELVDEWLASFGLGEKDFVRSPAKDWVTVKTPVRVAEKLLNTKYHVWKHSDTNEQLVRTIGYGLPDHLQSHVEVIQPTTLFARWNKLSSTLFFEGDLSADSRLGQNYSADILEESAVNPSCNATVTLSCLQQLYNFMDYKPKVPEKNSIAVSSYLEEFANMQDLRSFYLDQRPEAVNTTFKFVSVHGGLNNQSLAAAGKEANLDAQFAFGLSWPTRAIAWSTPGRAPSKLDLKTAQNTNEPYADWLDYVLSHEDLPHVISTSYGEEEQSVPESYARRVCRGILQLGVRGTSVIFSSGDFGVGDGESNPDVQKCLTNDGRNITRFMPTFPATCPYATAVGGTSNIPEVAAPFSGGGFSNYFPRPAYQANAVGKYLATLSDGTYKGLYNKTGRAFPDVAALGLRYRVWWRGHPISIGGTSASSPTFSAVVALLNDVRLSKGLSPLGFLNPWLYSRGAAGFNDITVGNNPGCGTPGFNATVGWDPVSGLGTPDFGKLKELLPGY